MVFVFQILPISMSRSSYLKSFLTYFTTTFLSDGTAISIGMDSIVDFPLTMVSGLFALSSLSVWMGMSHNIVTSFPSVAVFGFL